MRGTSVAECLACGSLMLPRMPHGLSTFAEVAVPIHVQGTFTYSIPESLRDDLRLGSRVEVPWGRGVSTGFVTALVDDPEGVELSKIKPIRTLLDVDEPALIPEIIELCRWAAAYYLAPLGEMLRSAVPANLASRSKRQVRAIADRTRAEEALREQKILPADLQLFDTMIGRDLGFRTIADEPGGRQSLKRLIGAGLVEVRDLFKDAAGVRQDRYVVLELPLEDLPSRQQQLIDWLQKHGGQSSVAALEAQGFSSSTIGTLARKNALRVEKRARSYTLDGFLASLGSAATGELQYSPEQKLAVETVLRSFGSFNAFLLEGVTGSGKTEVYVELMREAVKRGQQAILLVPEIALTPVFAARLRERFGERIAILHSNLSPSERYDQWWRARRGLVDVAIGPRSALFTPFPRLGLIVVDEEGDGAYKQDENPRYNARDLAVVRASLSRIPVLLGSATPSLESRENAERGKYQLLRLKTRIESRPLPEVEVVDLRKEKGEKEDRGLVIFSSRLKEELTRTFAEGQQAILLMNRRGYAPFLLCRECENDFRCRDCSVTLTVHRRAGLLICHYCGLRRKIPEKCPLCNGEVLQPIGFGTEKVHERFRSYFPEVAVDVLDRDSTRKRGELVRILDRFRRGETQALIGTQMISKGHHFPNVTLTGVITADAILGFPDFRSGEKTFTLLTQVAGRAGRGEMPGKVMVQSAFPGHYAIQHAIGHDYEAFFKAEMEFRTIFHYPPVTSMIALLIRGEKVEVVERAAEEVGRRIEKDASELPNIRIQGPAPAPLARIKGVYRYQILLRGPNRSLLRQLVTRHVIPFKRTGVEITIDVDPLNIL